MGFKCGIVGLPNIGKSTLFNALTKTMQAEAANYPFCTIEPNIGRVAVPDDRLNTLAKVAGSQKIIETQIEFVDIAGLVRGASKGEGLGNQFLSHIREVDAIAHVLRCFEDDDITHVEGKINPIRDAEIVELELILADLDSLEKRVNNLEKKAKTGDKQSKEQLDLIKEIIPVLEEGKLASTITHKFDSKQVKMLNLITTKKMMYICNVSEEDIVPGNEYTKKVAEMAKQAGNISVNISAKIEAEISNLQSEEEKIDFLESLGLVESGLTRVIKAGFELLNFITFFTIGPKEAHAWTVRKGALAPEAAGAIHTDFEKGFIRAEKTFCDDYIKYNGEQGAKEGGKTSLEGKDYLVQDGDILHFRFNV